MSESRRTNLGRGLAALLGEEEDAGHTAPAAGGETAPMRETRRLPIEQISPNPFQPRRAFDEESIDSLAESIRANGLLQPLLVRPSDSESDFYELVAGERRWRAAQRAQLHEVPVVIRALSDSEALEVAIVENVQRRDLTPLEEAQGYRRLIAEFGHTQEDLGRVVGKSRSHITNMLRLLQLPESVKDMMQSGALSAGHARALLGAEDPEALARQIAEDGLSVRQTETLAQAARQAATGRQPQSRPRRKSGSQAKDSDTRLLEEDLSNLLGVRVSIDHRGEKGGAVTLNYRSLDQLDDVLHRLMYGPAKRRNGADGEE